ncbi:hypothetical protein F5Y04DRAFT_32485 [Hypomontagnella monticulosa]|nr:hypothetical protein F5Y04DRAFT_32485 [Hypomontagnella monticulosa]
MAQSSHGWQSTNFPHGIGGPPNTGGDMNLGNFNGYQEFEGQVSSNQYFNPQNYQSYPPVQPEGHFRTEAFIPTQNGYYMQQNHGVHGAQGMQHAHGSQDMQHGHALQEQGGPDLRRYLDPAPFNTNAGYGTPFQDHQMAQFVPEPPSQSYAHAPNQNHYGPESWQGPPIQQAQQAQAQQAQHVQHVQSEFNQRPATYENHAPQLMYQPRPQSSQYSGNLNTTTQRNTMLHQDHGIPNLQQQSLSSFNHRNGQGTFSPQLPQQTIEPHRSQPHSNSTFVPFQPGMGAGGQQHRQMPEVVLARSSATPDAAQSTPTVSHQLPAGNPTAATVSRLTRPDGLPFLLVENAPSTRLSTFRDFVVAVKKTGDKLYAAKGKASTPLFPERQTRLPCEIQRDLEELSAILKSNQLSDAQKVSIESQMEQLYNEPVIMADTQESMATTQATKVKAGAKRKRSNLDPARKPGSTGSASDDDESPIDILARTIKSAPRPTDPDKALEYDVIKILWHDPKLPELERRVVPDKVNAFGDYVTDIWTKARDIKGEIKKHQDGPSKKLESLRTDLENIHKSLRLVIEAAVKFGDNFIISQLGSHAKFLGRLFITLRQLFEAEDYNGPLPKAILKLISLFVTVETEFLIEKVKLDRTRQKYKDNLDEEATVYMNQVFENAKQRSALKAQEARESPKRTDDIKKLPPGGVKKVATTSIKDMTPAIKASPVKKEVSLKKPITGIKKIQPIDYSGLESARKVSNVAGKANPPQASSKRPSDDDVDSRVPKKAAVENAAGAPSTAKTVPSTPTPAASQTSSTASAQARSRPSGSMLPGRSRVATKAQPKKPTPQQPASSAIGDLLASIQQPKEEPKQEEPTKPIESPEELERRLRKESRRHLRVSWKPEGELAEVRIFEHDTAEDKGRDHSMLRDARDNRSEGLRLKQNVQDMDDEGDGISDGNIHEYYEPIPYPESGLEECAMPLGRQGKAFVTRGGSRPVDSEQKKIMEEYESRELMAIYTSASEIPETPRSPTGKIMEVAKQPKIQVLQSDPSRWQTSVPPDSNNRIEIHQRWSDSIHFGRDAALQNARHRLKKSSSTSFNSFAKNSHNMSRPHSQPERLTDVLELLKSDKVKNYVDPDPYDPENPKTHRRHDYEDPKVQADANAIEDLFAEFTHLPFPPREPPKHIQGSPDRVKEWYDGYNRDLEAKANSQSHIQPQHQPQVQQPQVPQMQPQPEQQLPDGYAAILQQVQALQAGQYPTQPAPQPPQATMAPPTEQMNPAIQQALAALKGSASQPAPAAVPPTPTQPDATSLRNILAALNQTSTISTATPTPNPAYWQGWSQDHAQAQAQPQANQAYGGYGGYGYNTQPLGTDSQSQQQGMQTQGASNQRDGGDRGNRKDFQRGTKDHKGINRSLIGTKPCTFWAKGQCAKGDKCTFRHDPNDLK